MSQQVAPAAKADLECRVYQRQPCGLEASCQPVAARSDGDPRWPTVLRDLSPAGVGLVLGRRFERGAALAIEIPESPTFYGATLLARVTHTTALPERKWLLGCAFVSELSLDEVERLLGLAGAARAPAAGAGPASVVTTVLFRSLEGPWVAPLVVKRLSFKGTWPARPGTVLKVRRPQAGGAASEVKVRVQSCVEEDGHWAVTYVPIG